MCPTLCDPIDGSSPGSPVPGILKARTLEWVAISFSNVWNWKWKWSRSVGSDSLWPHGLQPTRLLCPWDFPGKSIGVECHCLLHLKELKSNNSLSEKTFCFQIICKYIKTNVLGAKICFNSDISEWTYSL